MENLEKSVENSKALVTLEGMIEGVIYHNEENGYTVFTLRVETDQTFDVPQDETKNSREALSFPSEAITCTISTNLIKASQL